MPQEIFLLVSFIGTITPSSFSGLFPVSRLFYIVVTKTAVSQVWPCHFLDTFSTIYFYGHFCLCTGNFQGLLCLPIPGSVSSWLSSIVI